MTKTKSVEPKESNIIYDLIRPDVPKGSHPVETNDYKMPTNEIITVLGSVCDWIEERVTGAIIYGRPRLGKTYMIEYLIDNISKVIAENIPVYHIISLHPKVVREEEFIESLLYDMNHNFALIGKLPAKRDRLFKFMLERGTSNRYRIIVLLVDEAQCLTEQHFEWLMDYYNKLQKEKVLLLTYLVGQQQLSAQKTIFKTSNAEQIVERFMAEEHKFSGVVSEEDIQTLLTCYDDPDKSEYPAGSGWSFTRYYFPEAYATGKRLADFSSTVYKLLKSVRQKENIKTAFEIPMHHMIRVIKIILLRYGKGSSDYEGGWISEAHWIDAINNSNYVKSEQQRTTLKVIK
ncbi:AAA family ATPase [Paenibacillus sp. LMG 31460]|uniref:AAA family ATPase n=1 Tax=Paenibacillus germinis TaxID=2654979 RepID=A0ABX1Z9R1_9BACL|nr:ATP-binding protein [Paenibacillus germinis]NOU89014.1 AAA family ATPase [Paenibacillus germinis]